MSTPIERYHAAKKETERLAREIALVLKEGADSWNRWRAENKHRFSEQPLLRRPVTTPVFDTESGLAHQPFGKPAFSITGQNLLKNGVELTGINLSGADFSGIEIDFIDFTTTDLSGADFGGSQLEFCDFRMAKLRNAKFVGTGLFETRFDDAEMKDADFSEAVMRGCSFPSVDLSEAKGLANVTHGGPSSVGLDTIYRSKAEIPDSFLLGAGVPGEALAFISSLRSNPIEFYSCFISHSHTDKEFVRKLYEALKTNKIRVWYAPEDMKGGQKLYDQIDQAIRLHDKVLLVLSNNSIRSEWVMTEVRRCRKRELKERRQCLFPIRLTDMETIKEWSCFDADSGKDLGAEVREYYIPDFSNWKDSAEFERGFAKLLAALKASETKT